MLKRQHSIHHLIENFVYHVIVQMEKLYCAVGFLSYYG